MNLGGIEIEEEDGGEIDMRAKYVISGLSDITMTDFAERYTPSPRDAECHVCRISYELPKADTPIQHAERDLLPYYLNRPTKTLLI